MFSDEKRGQALLQHDQALLQKGKTEYIDEEVHVDREGTIRWLQTSKVPILFKKSPILLGVSHDITQRKAYEDEIIQQANHDELTGLPNRSMFLEDLSQAISSEDAKDQRVAVMIIDLDRFKYINDTLGHDYGDLLLVQVAERLQQFLEKSLLLYSKVYRLGGDEFTLLHLRCSTEKAEQIAKRLVSAFNESFILHNQEFYISPSIGISVYPEHREDLKTLMRNADTAMYYVKDREKNNYQLFTKDMHQHFYRIMVIEKELRGALEREELELYYQPIVRVETGDIVGVESLLRWHHAELGTISPAEFIPVSEETGLILPLGEWVIREAARQCKSWQEQGHPPVKMGINISVRQLLDKHFVENVKRLLEEADLEPSLIDLEVTESIAMFDQKVMIDRLHTLKALGVTLSMDDFGTGYSSLSYLRNYPLDTLKIDRSFIQTIEQDENNQAIVASILSMAKHLRLEVTAEGVETEEDYAYLKAANCDKAQGYGIGYPVPARELW
nr:EAL domain-containing protein [Bacillus coahuilensis]